MQTQKTKILQAAVILLVAIFSVGCASSEQPAGDSQVVPDVEDEEGVNAGEAVTTAKLNLNEASGDDYKSVIPGFGNRMVREFLEYRPYISIQQFRREIGKYVSDEQVSEYEQYVFVPVDVDESDAETLKQIPGVDDTIAGELIAGRPYGSNDAFLVTLVEYLSEADMENASSYLATD